jgi:hypothetical protein
MADRKILFRSGTRVDELSPTLDRARIAGVISAASLDLAAASGNTVQILIGGATKVTITSDGRTDTSANSTVAAIRIGSVAGEPSTLSDGDVWYNSSSNKFRARENGASVDMIGGGGGGGGWTDSGTVVHLTTDSDTVAVGTTTMLGAEKVRVVGAVLADSVGQIYTAGVGGVIAARVVYKSPAANDTVLMASAAGLATCNGLVGVAGASMGAGLQVRVDTSGTVLADAAAGISVTAADSIYLSTAGVGEVTNVEPSASTQVKFYLGVAKTSTLVAGGTFLMNWTPRMPGLIP